MPIPSNFPCSLEISEDWNSRAMVSTITFKPATIVPFAIDKIILYSSAFQWRTPLIPSQNIRRHLFVPHTELPTMYRPEQKSLRSPPNLQKYLAPHPGASSTTVFIWLLQSSWWWWYLEYSKSANIQICYFAQLTCMTPTRSVRGG